MASIFQVAVLNAFCWMKVNVFWFEFSLIFVLESDWKCVSIGLGNDLAPDKQQANDGQDL